LTLRDFYERYGPTLAIAVVVALVLIILPGNPPAKTAGTTGVNASGQGASTNQVAGGEGAVDVSGTDATQAGALGVTGGSSPGARSTTGAGTTGSATGATPGAAAGTAQGSSSAATGIQIGKGPCRSDGRMLGIARYMPPCLSFSGPNGGATSRGVGESSVKIIRFVSLSDPATDAILKANKLADDAAVVTRAFQALFKFGNSHYETYGREVQYAEYQATGKDSNDEAMRNDARTIVDREKPFAVISGPKVLGQELAARGVICICTVSLSSDFYKENPPYIFGSLPTSTEYAMHSAEFIGKKLRGKKAVYAGDDFNPAQGFKAKERKFGLIYIEGSEGRVDPEGKRARDAFARELGKYGVTLCDGCEASYLYDPGRNQQDMTTMIARLKAAGVTTVIMVVDPLTPIIITAEASRQQFFPEWFVTGTGLSDTSAAGRLYDKNQWSHAFGLSPLWVTWVDVKQSEGYREFHHGMPGMQPGDEGVLINIYRAPVQQVFTGIHMAGPKLTADTFTQGMYNYPRTGGTAAAPLVYLTRDYPTQIKDMVEVWFSTDERGKDERGEDGFGMMMKVDGGARFEVGKYTTADTKAFIRQGAIAVSDNPAGGGPFPHEQDGHKHTKKCLSCSG
jgi:hypothetical protein